MSLVIPEREVVRLNLMQAGMHVYDNQKNKAADSAKVFQRANKRNVKWVGGTEAGNAEDRALYAEIARENGFRFANHPGNDAWIAVRDDFITGGWDTYYDRILGHTQGEGPHGQRGVFSVEFDTEHLGHITVIVMHLLTHGRPGSSPDRRVNVKWNEMLMRAVGAHARERGAGGRNLVFCQADTNIIDRTTDTFFGEPLTSAWDELKKWEGTGHGNIDVIASYDADNRVSAAYCRALDDSEFPLHTDHFVVEAGFDVLSLAIKPVPTPHPCPSCGFEHTGILR